MSVLKRIYKHDFHCKPTYLKRARIDAAGALHHIICRKIERRMIFSGPWRSKAVHWASRACAERYPERLLRLGADAQPLPFAAEDRPQADLRSADLTPNRSGLPARNRGALRSGALSITGRSGYWARQRWRWRCQGYWANVQQFSLNSFYGDRAGLGNAPVFMRSSMFKGRVCFHAFSTAG